MCRTLLPTFICIYEPHASPKMLRECQSPWTWGYRSSWAAWCGSPLQEQLMLLTTEPSSQPCPHLVCLRQGLLLWPGPCWLERERLEDQQVPGVLQTLLPSGITDTWHRLFMEVLETNLRFSCLCDKHCKCYLSSLPSFVLFETVS